MHKGYGKRHIIASVWTKSQSGGKQVFIKGKRIREQVNRWMRKEKKFGNRQTSESKQEKKGMANKCHQRFKESGNRQTRVCRQTKN